MALRLRFGMVSCRQPMASSSGNRVRRRNSTMMASSAGVSTVLLGVLGPMGASVVVLRLRQDGFGVETELAGGGYETTPAPLGARLACARLACGGYEHTALSSSARPVRDGWPPADCGMPRVQGAEDRLLLIEAGEGASDRQQAGALRDLQKHGAGDRRLMG
jgi:hypothetical protein